MGSFTNSRGPMCRFRLLQDVDSGTLCLQPSLQPGPLGRFSIWPEMRLPGFIAAALGADEAITDRDKAEFEAIRKMQVLDARRRRYSTIGQYISDRTLYFGAPVTYWAFAAESDAELENTRWGKGRWGTLKSRIELGAKPEQQKIFYRWVRKAYQRRYGSEVDVPELIRRGMSQELADKIQAVRGSVRVKGKSQDDFKAGGFNPRPIKYNGRYLLGTLSEHGTGMAVDIDPAQNPQLTLAQWAFIEQLSGKKVKRSGRWQTEADAEALWKDIKALSDAFVRKVAAETKRIEKEREEKAAAEAKKQAAKAGAPKVPGKADSPAASSAAPAKSGTKTPAAKAPKVATALEEVLGAHHEALKGWAHKGFLGLPLELVLELHAHGFQWGAAFGTNVDLHHFELDAPSSD